MRRLTFALIALYQATISPLLGPACRYFPSCSEYTREAIEKYGVGHGIWMGMKRIGRCHPLHEGGYDPVP